MNKPLTPEEKIAVLEEEIFSLRARLFDLEKAFGQYWCAPRVLPVTKFTEKLLGLFYAKKQIVYKEQIYELFWGGALDPPTQKIIDVQLCKLRKQLRPFGITIETIFGRGYRLTDEGRAKLAELEEKYE